MPTVYMLIGLPGSGKTTWRENTIASSDEEFVVISQDDMIDNFAWQNNLTYNEAFKIAPLHDFAKQARADFRKAIAEESRSSSTAPTCRRRRAHHSFRRFPATTKSSESCSIATTLFCTSALKIAVIAPESTFHLRLLSA